MPGYVKCPKCGNPLPAFARTKSNTFGGGGGTAVSDRPVGSRLNLFIALGAGLAIAIILVAVLGGGGGSKTASTTNPTTEPDPTTDDTTPTQPTQPDEPGPPGPTQPTTNDGNAQAAAAELDRELKRQRLWGTVSVIDQRVDVRSGACEDKAMGPMIDAARPRLQSAGLTKLRCLAQSGTVVFERDL